MAPELWLCAAMEGQVTARWWSGGSLGPCLATHPCRHRTEGLSGMGSSVCNVVGWRVMFCVVIHEICRSFVPIKLELVLCCSAAEPVEAHPDHFDAVLDDGVLKESRSH